MAYNPSINYDPTQAPGSPAGGTGSYNVNPHPQGTGGILGDVFGRVPGAVQMPTPYNDLQKVYPNLPATNAAASQDILSNLEGNLSPNTITAIQDASNRFGLPTTDLNLSPRSLGETSDELVDQGLKEFTPFLKTTSATQTVSPATQAMIASFNAMNRASPDPSAVGIAGEALSAVGMLAAL